jgi:hypothetical protein
MLTKSSNLDPDRELLLVALVAPMNYVFSQFHNSGSKPTVDGMWWMKNRGWLPQSRSGRSWHIWGLKQTPWSVRLMRWITGKFASGGVEGYCAAWLGRGKDCLQRREEANFRINPHSPLGIFPAIEFQTMERRFPIPAVSMEKLKD